MSHPIVPQDFISGVNVVDIGDIRVARGKTRRPFSTCRHARLVYDPLERRIWCEDCERDVEPFDAFALLVERYAHIEMRHQALEKAATATLVSRAAKRLDDAFRKRNMVPLCPHCRHAIFPDDVMNGLGMISKELAQKRRDKEAKKNAESDAADRREG